MVIHSETPLSSELQQEAQAPRASSGFTYSLKSISTNKSGGDEEEEESKMGSLAELERDLNGLTEFTIHSLEGGDGDDDGYDSVLANVQFIAHGGHHDKHPSVISNIPESRRYMERPDSSCLCESQSNELLSNHHHHADQAENVAFSQPLGRPLGYLPQMGGGGGGATSSIQQFKFKAPCSDAISPPSSCAMLPLSETQSNFCSVKTGSERFKKILN